MILLLLGCTPAEDTGFGSPAEAVDEDPAEGRVAFTLEASGPPAAAKSEGHDALESWYSYNGQVPGPTLRARVGDTVTVVLENALDVPTAIHWHGLDAPADQDSQMLEPGERGSFTFPAQRAGTFWYHAASSVSTQVAGGLYGVFVVEDPEEPRAERELILVWQTGSGGTAGRDAAEDADAHDEDTGHTDVVASAKAEGHEHETHAVTDPAELAWTVNGVSLPTYTWDADQRVRVRMLNVSALGYLQLATDTMRHIGGDQGLLANESDAATVLMAPGDRADFEWTDGDFTVTTGLYGAEGGAALGDPQPLMVAAGGGASAIDWGYSGALPTADDRLADATLVLSGGGDSTWLINGRSWPDVAPVPLPVGVAQVLEIRNLSSSEHAIHLHGAPFEVLSVDGVPPDSQTWEDTMNVPSLSSMRIRVTMDEAADWPLHCQAHAHEEGGMKVVLHAE